MWLHHDASWWALALAILALILMLPVNLLANFMTPILKNWWAERSAAATRTLIEALEKQLVDHEQYKEMSEGEDYILMATEGLSMLLALCTSMLSVVLLSLVAFATPTPSADDRHPVMLLAVFSALAAFLIGIIGFGRISKFRRTRSPFVRAGLRKNIGQLKDRLAQRNLPS